MSSLFANTTGVVKTGQSSLVFRDPTIWSLFSIGDEVTITVVERISARQYLMNVKERMILADSVAPLQTGSALRVRIDQQHPRMVLRILSESAVQRDIIAENIRFFRVNPQGLLTNLMQAEDLLTQAILHPRISILLQDDIAILLQLIHTLRYSENTLGNRDYLRDYAATLGMFMESDVRKALLVKGERGLRNDSTPSGVKGLFYCLAENLNNLLRDDTMPDDLRLFLQQLQASAEKTVRTIENQQILNVMLRERENASMLQIPLLIPGGMKLAEVFIKDNDNAYAPSRYRHSFTVALLFDLDILGQIFIELHVHDKRLECLFICSEEMIQEFVFSHLPELQEKLLDMGYRVDRMNCVVEEDMEKQKTIIYQNYQLFAGGSINVFA
jgi:hypothetical protein